MSIDHRNSDGRARAVGEGAENWLAENRVALESSNAWVEVHGLPLDRVRARHDETQRQVEQGDGDARGVEAIPDAITRAATLTLPQDASGAPED